MEFIKETKDFIEDHPLRDYWIVLVRRSKVILLVLALVLVSGYLYTRSLPVLPFPFITVIEIGTAEIPEEVRAKVERVYIPNALIEHSKTGQYDVERYSVSFDLTTQSRLLTLRSFGSDSAIKDLTSIHHTVVAALLEDQKDKEQIFRNSLRREKARIEAELKSLEAEEKLFPARFRRIEDARSILQKKITVEEDAIADLEQKRSTLLAQRIQKNLGQELELSTFFIIDSDIQKHRERRSVFEGNISVDLSTQLDSLEKAQIEGRRRQEDQKKAAEDVQLKIDTLKTTQVLISPQRQLRQTAGGPINIIGTSAILGLLLGVLGAFFVEFASNARKGVNRFTS